MLMNHQGSRQFCKSADQGSLPQMLMNHQPHQQLLMGHRRHFFNHSLSLHHHTHYLSFPTHSLSCHHLSSKPLAFTPSGTISSPYPQPLAPASCNSNSTAQYNIYQHFSHVYNANVLL